MGKRQVLGIDIGTGTVKAMSGWKDDDGSVSVNSLGIVPTIGFEKGVACDIKLLTNAILQAVECAVSAHEKSDQCVYLGIGGLGIRSFRGIGSIAPSLPDAITANDVDRACRAAALTCVPDDYSVLHVLPILFRVDKQSYDKLPVRCQGSCLEVEACVVAVPTGILKQLVGSLTDAGLIVVGTVANMIAEKQVLKIPSGNGLIVDMGAGITDIALFNDTRISYFASLPLGGNYITRDIMQGLKISYEHAEEVKRYYARLDPNLRGRAEMLDCNDYGTTDKKVPYDFLHNIVESRVNEIICLIYDYLKPTLAECAMETIVFTGGCAAMPSMQKSFSQVFGVPVEVAKPVHIPQEYAYLSNSACYGVLCNALEHDGSIENVASSTSSNYWHSLFKKLKKFF